MSPCKNRTRALQNLHTKIRRARQFEGYFGITTELTYVRLFAIKYPILVDLSPSLCLRVSVFIHFVSFFSEENGHENQFQ